MTGVLLAVLLLRAYIPVGFMPASGAPFLLQLCPAAAPAMAMSAGMPMSMPAHQASHHHSPAHGHFDNCPFGSAPATGPLSHWVAFEPPAFIPSRPPLELEVKAFGLRLERAHQPRGPPAA